MVGKSKGKEVWIPRYGKYVNMLFWRRLLSHGMKDIDAIIEYHLVNLLLLMSGTACLIILLWGATLYVENSFLTTVISYLFTFFLLTIFMVMLYLCSIPTIQRKDLIIMDDNSLYYLSVKSPLKCNWSDIKEGEITFGTQRTRNNNLKTKNRYCTLTLTMHHGQEERITLPVPDYSVKTFRKELVECFRVQKISLHWTAPHEEEKKRKCL